MGGVAIDGVAAMIASAAVASCVVEVSDGRAARTAHTVGGMRRRKKPLMSSSDTGTSPIKL